MFQFTMQPIQAATVPLALTEHDRVTIPLTYRVTVDWDNVDGGQAYSWQIATPEGVIVAQSGGYLIPDGFRFVARASVLSYDDRLRAWLCDWMTGHAGEIWRAAIVGALESRGYPVDFDGNQIEVADEYDASAYPPPHH